MDLVFFVAGFLGLGLLQPVDELLHLLHEDSPSLGNVAVLVPLEDNLLAEDLSLVEEEHDLVEALEETLVVVAVFLDLVVLCLHELSKERDGSLQQDPGILLRQPEFPQVVQGRPHSQGVDCLHGADEEVHRLVGAGRVRGIQRRRRLGPRQPKCQKHQMKKKDT